MAASRKVYGIVTMIIEVEKIKYYVEITGRGKPVVCLHGFAEDHSTWRDLHLHGCTLYKIDLLGHGRSDKPDNPKYYAMDSMVEHLHTLIHELAITNYTVMGYSMGGRLAVAYAFLYRDEIERLILESTSFGIKDEAERLKRYESDRKLAEKIIFKGVTWFEKHWSAMEIFQTQKKLSKAIREEIKQRRLLNVESALANTLLGSGQGVMPYYADKIPCLPMSILYLSGELDEKYVQLGWELAEKNRNMLCISIAKAGHNVHLEQPEPFQRLLEHFLNNSK